MRVNYDFANEGTSTIDVPEPAPAECLPGGLEGIFLDSGADARPTAPSGVAALLAARNEVIRGQSWETAVWLALAVSGLGVLVVSLWI